MNKNYFRKFPTFKTQRLILAPITHKDDELVYNFNSSLETLKYVDRNLFTHFHQGVDKVSDFINEFDNQSAFWWSFKCVDSDESIGYGGIFDIDHISQKAEIGYGIQKAYWKKGYTSEAISEIVRFALSDLELHKLFGKIDPENIASIKVLEKLGFQQEGILKDDLFARGKYFDMYYYSLLNTNNK